MRYLGDVFFATLNSSRQRKLTSNILEKGGAEAITYVSNGWILLPFAHSRLKLQTAIPVYIEKRCSDQLIGISKPYPNVEDVQIQWLRKNAKQRKTKYNLIETCGMFSSPNDCFITISKLIKDKFSITYHIISTNKRQNVIEFRADRCQVLPRT